MLIMVTLSHMNELLQKRGIKCPDCDPENIEYKPTKLTGINYFRTLECPDCLKHAGNWCLS